MDQTAPPDFSTVETGIVPPEVAIGMPGLTFLKQLLDRTHPAPPFSATAEIWMEEIEAGRAVFAGLPSERFYNPMGTVHGGWIAALLDSAMACAVHSMLKAGQAYTTVELKTNFLRPLFARTGQVRCEAEIVHIGGRIATSEGKVLDADGKLIAHGSETCMILKPGA